MVIIKKKLNENEQTHTFILSAKIARVGMLLERFYAIASELHDGNILVHVPGYVVSSPSTLLLVW